jgi:hypothetical protein
MGARHQMGEVEEAQRIAELRETLLEQSKRIGFDPAPFERAAELLESLPPTEFIDKRVQFALDLQTYLSEEAEHMEYFAMQRTLKRAAERALTNG